MNTSDEMNDEIDIDLLASLDSLKVVARYRDVTEAYKALQKLWDPDCQQLEESQSKSTSRAVWHHSQPRMIMFTEEFIDDISDIDRKLQGRILEAISTISMFPTQMRGDTIKPLGYEKQGFWRYRIGNYRLIYSVEKQFIVRLVRFTSRGEAYS